MKKTLITASLFFLSLNACNLLGKDEKTAEPQGKAKYNFSVPAKGKLVGDKFVFVTRDTGEIIELNSIKSSMSSVHKRIYCDGTTETVLKDTTIVSYKISGDTVRFSPSYPCAMQTVFTGGSDIKGDWKSADELFVFPEESKKNPECKEQYENFNEMKKMVTETKGNLTIDDKNIFSEYQHTFCLTEYSKNFLEDLVYTGKDIEIKDCLNYSQKNNKGQTATFKISNPLAKPENFEVIMDVEAEFNGKKCSISSLSYPQSRSCSDKNSLFESIQKFHNCMKDSGFLN